MLGSGRRGPPETLEDESDSAWRGAERGRCAAWPKQPDHDARHGCEVRAGEERSVLSDKPADGMQSSKAAHKFKLCAYLIFANSSLCGNV